MSAVTQVSPKGREEFERSHDQVVREEIESFRRTAEAYLAGQISEDQFRAFRLKQGIYGQRQAGVQMVRTKIPGGLATAAQMEQLALVADRFAGGKGHITTRQNMQFHFVKLLQVPDLLHLLADAGLTNRAACYNAVRNVTACPLAGISRDEVFNVLPYAQKLAYALLRHEITENLPRKFKIAFDGCPANCVAGAIHDVSLQAQIRDGRRGFRMAIGGGLGPLPMEAQLLEEFLPEEFLIQKCEAVIRAFYKHGNRGNKNKARMKFIIRERGFDWLKEQIDTEYAEILAHGGIAWPEMVPEGFGGYQSVPQPLGQGALLPVVSANGGNGSHGRQEEWLRTNVIQQKQPGYAAVLVRIEQGNLSSQQMRGLARIARDSGDGGCRITIDQNILLAYLPLAKLPAVHAALEELGLGGARARQIDDITTCPGAYSCNLGLTKSMNLGAALAEVVGRYDDPAARALSIKISGCPNSCGQHWISDFGFYGNARKIDGKEVPYYLMLLGGGYDEQGVMRFGLAVQSLPARLAPAAVERVVDHFLAHRRPEETFRQYVMRHKVEFFRQATAGLAKPAAGNPEMFQDWGDDTAFSLQLGRGECAA
ncbi:MAG: nitrite/sulfite reductase [Acidobacteria bacterium]|nr:nitrite/sulfite reductase [Acidobacteriota bacterium]